MNKFSTGNRFAKPLDTSIPMNERIRYHQVRLIGPDGDQLGITTSQEALRKARELNLDLIEVASTSTPPVCRIIDYGKWKYEQDKKKHEEARKQKQSELKEIKMFPNIEEHDFQTKLRNILRFIAEGDKVKVSIIFKGREIAHTEFGYELANKIITAVEAAGGSVESPTSLVAKSMTVVLSPKAAKKSTPAS